MGAQHSQGSVYKTKYSTDSTGTDPIAVYVTTVVTRANKYFDGGEVSVDGKKIEERREELRAEIDDTLDKYMQVFPDEEDSDFDTLDALKTFTNAKDKLFLMVRLFLSLYRAVQVLSVLDGVVGSESTLKFYTVEELKRFCEKRSGVWFDAYVLTLLLDKLNETWTRFVRFQKQRKQVDVFILLAAHVQPLNIDVHEDEEVVNAEITSQTLLNYFVTMFGQLATLREVSHALHVLTTQGQTSNAFKSALSVLAARLAQFETHAKRQQSTYISNTIYETLHARFQEKEARVATFTQARPVILVITTHGYISKPTTAVLAQNLTLARIAHAAPGRSAAYPNTNVFSLLINAIRVQGADVNAARLLELVQATVGTTVDLQRTYRSLEAQHVLLQENNIAVRHFPGERYLNKEFSVDGETPVHQYDWAITALYNGRVIDVLAELHKTKITSQELIDYAILLQQPAPDIANIIMLDFSCSNFSHAQKKVRDKKAGMEINVKLKRQRFFIEEEEAIERKRAKKLMEGIAGGLH